MEINTGFWLNTLNTPCHVVILIPNHIVQGGSDQLQVNDNHAAG